jgi:hypothetical protein
MLSLARQMRFQPARITAAAEIRPNGRGAAAASSAQAPLAPVAQPRNRLGPGS